MRVSFGRERPETTHLYTGFTMLIRCFMSQEAKTELISKDMPIADVVAKYPSIVDTLQSYGIHCVGCGASTFETIDQGFKGHGMSDTEIEAIVEELNRVAKTAPKPVSHVHHEGPVLIVTEKAANKISEMLKQHNKIGWGLRIGVVPGGCSGFQYSMGFDEKATETDKVVEEKGVKIFVDEKSLDKLWGCSVDYVESLQGAGFKIENPNASSGCGCGKSFG